MIRIVSLLLTIILSYCAYNELKEWYKVGLLNEIGGYPWGEINDNPWFYKEPKYYSIVSLTTGISFLIANSFSIIGLLKNQYKYTLYSLILFLSVIILTIINGTIK